MFQSKQNRNQERVMPKQETPVRIASASAAGTVLTLTFDQAVRLKKTPQYETDIPEAAPVEGGAALTSPTTLALTFDADISLATELTIPFQDQGIRGTVGGYIADTTFPLAA